MGTAFTFFNTVIGRCAIAWAEDNIVGIQLPERDDGTTSARLKRRYSRARRGQPPAFVIKAIAEIETHLLGKKSELDAIPIDLTRVSDFDRKVLTATRRIPVGTTRTYGAIATDLGDPSAARAVGAALGRNPWPIVIPCHRVVAANGRLGGFSAPGGRASKIKLLGIEDAKGTSEPSLFDGAKSNF